MTWWIVGGIVLALRYHLDDPVPEPPDGGWPNQLQNYYVRPQDRV
jgi:hypothetical protein